MAAAKCAPRRSSKSDKKRVSKATAEKKRVAKIKKAARSVAPATRKLNMRCAALGVKYGKLSQAQKIAACGKAKPKRASSKKAKRSSKGKKRSSMGKKQCK